MPIYFNEKEIVLPGQLLSDDSKRAGENTYVQDNKVYAATVGMATVRNGKVEVIALKGPYRPKSGDVVIGVVTDIKSGAVEIDLGGGLTGVVKVSSIKELESLGLNVGDVVYTKVNSSGIRGILLEKGEHLKKIKEGIILFMTPTKIPRLIGKRGSMINMLKKLTGCNILVGMNGMIVIKGSSPTNEFAMISAIRMIEREAHSSGLTDRVASYVASIVGGEKEIGKDDETKTGG